MNLISIWKRLQGQGGTPPQRQPLANIFKAGLGATVTLLTLACFSQYFEHSLMLGSLGASCLMVFAFPDLPFSQPRHVLCGHVLSSLIGVACLQFLGEHAWTVALAVGLSVVLMMYFNITHPPAASNPIIVYLGHSSWGFVVFPTAFGALLVLTVALIYNNLTRKTAYPVYW